MAAYVLFSFSLTLTPYSMFTIFWYQKQQPCYQWKVAGDFRSYSICAQVSSAYCWVCWWIYHSISHQSLLLWGIRLAAMLQLSCVLHICASSSCFHLFLVDTSMFWYLAISLQALSQGEYKWLTVWCPHCYIFLWFWHISLELNMCASVPFFL